MEPGRVLPAGRSAARLLLIFRLDREALRAALADLDGDTDLVAETDGLAAWRASAFAEPIEAAVLVAITQSTNPGVLLTRRADTLRRHAGQVSFPGGRIDPADPSPEHAALREAHEEIGLPPQAVELLGRLRPLVTGTGYRITPVVGLIGDYKPQLCAAEVHSVFELPLSVLLDPAAPTQRRAMFGGQERAFWVWPHEQHEIWGATAAILVHLARRLRSATG